MDFFDKNVAHQDFEGWTLVLGSPSVGHVGQLTADLILANGNLAKIGRLFHGALDPMVAVVPTETTNIDDTSDKIPSLLTSAELYVGPNKVALLHLRGPVSKRGEASFVACLGDLAEKMKVGKVVVMGGTFASERNDAQLASSGGGVRAFRYVATPNLSADLLERMERLGWEELEKRLCGGRSEVEAIHIPGSGLTKRLLEECGKRGIACVGFLMFASDGIAPSEVIPFFEAIWGALVESVKGVKIPEVWKREEGGSGDRLNLIY